MEAIYKLRGVVQHYSWGGTRFIPALLGLANEEQKPFAEYWLGAHPNAPSIVEGKRLPLDRLIGQEPAEVLGEAVAHSFGSLPFLFKVLDVRQMLSIQVHPSKAAAIEEYKKENEKGIPVTAPHRNYKDQNHKPELMVALSDFYLLHGFKNEADLRQIVDRVPALSFLLPFFVEGGYQRMYEEVMTMPQENIDRILAPLLTPLLPQYAAGGLQKSDENFWAVRAVQTFCKEGHYDRGIFSIYLFNLLYLKQGEAIFQAAGLPHAYLEGQNIEVMANSDNVLRAGLTDKHIDVQELMKHVRFEATIPKIIRAADAHEQTYDSPADEFLLEKYEVAAPVSVTAATAAILFLYEGKATVVSEGKEILLNRGEAALSLAGKQVTITPLASTATLFSVTAPVRKK